MVFKVNENQTPNTVNFILLYAEFRIIFVSFPHLQYYKERDWSISNHVITCVYSQRKATVIIHCVVENCCPTGLSSIHPLPLASRKEVKTLPPLKTLLCALKRPSRCLLIESYLDVSVFKELKCHTRMYVYVNYSCNF